MTIYPSSNVGLEMGPKMLKETRDGMMTVLPSGWQDCVTQLRHSPPPSWLLRWSVTPRETRLVDQMIDCVNKKFDMFDWVHPFWWENTNRLGTSLLSLSKSRASSNCFWLKPFQAPRQPSEAILRTHGGELILDTQGSGEIRYVNNTYCRVKPVLYQTTPMCAVWISMRACPLAKADRRPREKKKCYHQFSIVKYSYLPKDTIKKLC